MSRTDLKPLKGVVSSLLSYAGTESQTGFPGRKKKTLLKTKNTNNNNNNNTGKKNTDQTNKQTKPKPTLVWKQEF